MKCDYCKHMKFYDAGPVKKLDDKSFHYCEKEYWQFNEELDLEYGPPSGLDSEIDESIDIWSDCKDFEDNIITDVINDTIINELKTGEPSEDLIPFKK